MIRVPVNGAVKVYGPPIPPTAPPGPKPVLPVGAAFVVLAFSGKVPIGVGAAPAPPETRLISAAPGKRNLFIRPSGKVNSGGVVACGLPDGQYSAGLTAVQIASRPVSKIATGGHPR